MVLNLEKNIHEYFKNDQNYTCMFFQTAREIIRIIYQKNMQKQIHSHACTHETHAKSSNNLRLFYTSNFGRIECMQLRQ
jgi:hypothetical protein